MRKVINLQMEFWKKDIANIEFDLQSRDEIPGAHSRTDRFSASSIQLVVVMG